MWNITTIEDWEIDRHETLLRRAKAMGGYLDGPDGMQVRIKRQEFPFDIGIWSNVKQGMGTGNVCVCELPSLFPPANLCRFLPGSGPFPRPWIQRMDLTLRQMEWKV